MTITQSRRGGFARRAALTCGAALAVTALAVPAHADPKAGDLVTVDCGDGPVDYIVPGNGYWQAGHAVDGSTVIRPVAFVGLYNTVWDVDDAMNVIVSEYIPDYVKNGNRYGAGILECTMVQEVGPFYEPYFGTTIVARWEGTILAKLSAG